MSGALKRRSYLRRRPSLASWDLKIHRGWLTTDRRPPVRTSACLPPRPAPTAVSAANDVDPVGIQRWYNGAPTGYADVKLHWARSCRTHQSCAGIVPAPPRGLDGAHGHVGSQHFSVAGLTGPHGQIRYFVDSSAFRRPIITPIITDTCPILPHASSAAPRTVLTDAPGRRVADSPMLAA